MVVIKIWKGLSITAGVTVSSYFLFHSFGWKIWGVILTIIIALLGIIISLIVKIVKGDVT
jgi:fatty acid desaturase